MESFRVYRHGLETADQAVSIGADTPFDAAQAFLARQGTTDPGVEVAVISANGIESLFAYRHQDIPEAHLDD